MASIPRVRCWVAQLLQAPPVSEVVDDDEFRQRTPRFVAAQLSSKQREQAPQLLESGPCWKCVLFAQGHGRLLEDRPEARFCWSKLFFQQARTWLGRWRVCACAMAPNGSICSGHRRSCCQSRSRLMPLCFPLRSCLWNLSPSIPWRFPVPELFPQPEAVDSSVLPAPEIVESPQLPLMDPLEDLPLRSRCHNHRRLLPQLVPLCLAMSTPETGASRVESFGCPSCGAARCAAACSARWRSDAPQKLQQELELLGKRCSRKPSASNNRRPRPLNPRKPPQRICRISRWLARSAANSRLEELQLVGAVAQVSALAHLVGRGGAAQPPL